MRVSRPAQVVVTMPPSLKRALMAKSRATKTPMAKAIRIFAEMWVGSSAVDVDRVVPILRRR
jgi:hypothetical protein